MADIENTSDSPEIEELRTEIAGLRELLLTLITEMRGSEKKETLTGVAVKTSDLMSGFQGALARAIEARRAGDADSGEDIGNYVIQDMEVEFAAPLVAERGGDEPILLIPNVKSVTEASPLVRLKFKIDAEPPRAEEGSA